jgi:sporulation-control protein spo0M
MVDKFGFHKAYEMTSLLIKLHDIYSELTVYVKKGDRSKLIKLLVLKATGDYIETVYDDEEDEDLAAISSLYLTIEDGKVTLH